jgi:tRNA 2-thiouridine synthesizing protein A
VAAAHPGPEAVAELDLRGEVCPYTFLKARLALDELPAGAVLCLVVDNETSARDVPRSLAGAGHAVIESASTGDGAWVIRVRRGPG